MGGGEENVPAYSDGEGAVLPDSSFYYGHFAG